MHPADLATERQRRARREHNKLAQAVRHATLNATEAERVELARTIRQHTAGTITLEQLRQHVNELLTTQHARRAAA